MSGDALRTSIALPTLAELCERPDDLLGTLDVGIVNLLCASGLPEAENLDLERYLTWLDEAARQVDLSIRRHTHRLHNFPTIYNNSPGYFCCYHLVQTLQEDLGVRYNPARITDSEFQNPLCLKPDFRDSRDLFIHGIIDGPGGTCASMPVLYVAVGRRLGLPLKLVETAGHLFVRWEDVHGHRFGIPERFNIEATGSGMSTYPDDFYRTWPMEWKPCDEPGGWYLRSLSLTEELAAFLSTRASCLEDHGRTQEAIDALSWAVKLAPTDLRYATHLIDQLRRGYEAGRAALDAERAFLDSQRLIALQPQHREVTPIHLQSPVIDDTPHGESCQCLHCRQARQSRQNKGMPGHPANCRCFHCRKPQSDPFAFR